MLFPHNFYLEEIHMTPERMPYQSDTSPIGTPTLLAGISLSLRRSLVKWWSDAGWKMVQWCNGALPTTCTIYFTSGVDYRSLDMTWHDVKREPILQSHFPSRVLRLILFMARTAFFSARRRQFNGPTNEEEKVLKSLWDRYAMPHQAGFGFSKKHASD